MTAVIVVMRSGRARGLLFVRSESEEAVSTYNAMGTFGNIRPSMRIHGVTRLQSYRGLISRQFLFRFDDEHT